MAIWQNGWAFVFGQKSRRPITRRTASKPTFRPWAEVLEVRNAPAWTPLGSATMLSLNTAVGIQLGGDNPGDRQQLSGRIDSIAIAENFYAPNSNVAQKAAFLGEASGGVWRSTNFDGNGNLANIPTWTFVSGTVAVSSTNNNPAPRETIVGANNIGAIAVDSNRSNVVYAGTGEPNFSADAGAGTGLLKSTDGGQTWFVASRGPDNAFVGHAFAKIIIDPTVTSGSGVLYAAVVPVGRNLVTPRDGLYKSTNGGATWTKLTLTFQGVSYPLAVVTDLEYTLSSSGNTGPDLFNLFAAVGNPRGYFQGTFGLGVYSNDVVNGIWKMNRADVPTWTPLDRAGDALTVVSGAGIGRISLAADHHAGANDQRIYAAVSSWAAPNEPEVENSGPPKLLKVVKSDNNGQDWTYVLNPQRPDQNDGRRARDILLASDDREQGFGIQSIYNLALAVDPNNSNVVYLGGVHTWRSANAGTDWLQIDVLDGGAGAIRSHPDHHAWAFSGTTVLDGNDGGIWKFAPAAGTWTNENGTTLATLQVTSVASDWLGTILMGTQDNGTARLVPNQWEMTRGGDGGMVRFAPSSPRVAYRIANGTAGGAGGLIFEISENSGLTWENIGGFASDRSFPFAPVFAISPTNAGNLVMGSTKAWDRSLANLLEWPSLWLDRPQIRTNGITADRRPMTVSAVAFADSETYYVGFENGELWRKSGNPFVGLQFTRLVAAGGGPWGKGPITHIEIDPSSRNNALNAKAIYITIGGWGNHKKVYQSLQGGEGGNWDDLSGDLPNVPVNTLVIDTRRQARTLYIGTDIGVFSAPLQANPNWTAFNDGLPLVKVTDLQKDGPRILVAATYGRGVYRTELPRLAAVEGNRETDLALGQVSDPGETGPYSIKVTWGDGTVSTATPNDPNEDITLTQDENDATKWVVTGAHTYDTWDDYSAEVTLYDGSYDFTGTPPEPIDTTSTTLTVGDAELTVEFDDFEGDAETPLSTNKPIASFTDANPNSSASDFYVIIDWGDGLTSDSRDNDPEVWVEADNDPGHYLVFGAHEYAYGGAYPVGIHIGADGDSIATGAAMATIAGDPPPVNYDVYFGATLGATLNVPGEDDNYTLLDYSGNSGNEEVSITEVNGSDANIDEETETYLGGTVIVHADGTFEYTAPDDAVGADHFDVTYSDGETAHSGTVYINVTDVIVFDADFSTLKNQTLTVSADPGGLLHYAFAASGEELSISEVDGSAENVGENVSITGGTVNITATGAVSFVPTSNFTGDASVEVTVTDGIESKTIVVNFHVVQVLAGDAEYTVVHNNGLSIPDMTQLSLVDHADEADSATLEVVAINGDYDAINEEITTAMGGTIVVQADGSFEYTPPEDFVGDDWASYTVSNGDVESTAAIIIHVTNAAPVYSSPPQYWMSANQTLSMPQLGLGALLDNATDDDGDDLTIVAVNDDYDAIDAEIATTHGTITVQADGSFVYDPDTDFTGDDTFTITVSDGFTTVTVTVTIHVS